MSIRKYNLLQFNFLFKIHNLMLMHRILIALLYHKTPFLKQKKIYNDNTYNTTSKFVN